MKVRCQWVKRSKIAGQLTINMLSKLWKFGVMDDMSSVEANAWIEHGGPVRQQRRVFGQKGAGGSKLGVVSINEGQVIKRLPSMEERDRKKVGRVLNNVPL
ncbi:hypothetical protein VNO78_08402 [Psophocarpus tetragonolobus]|uniref:Uncharacterized protein n=1 Tax=Psophocarpus tetragonolobus TaxID=3891 RepID=A0AAN9SX53_PSOTE